MTDTELVLRSLLAVLEMQGVVADALDALPNEVSFGSETLAVLKNWREDFGGRWQRLVRVENPEGGRHRVTGRVDEYESVAKKDRRRKGGVRTDRVFAGTRLVVTDRYDTLLDLIRDRLGDKK